MIFINVTFRLDPEDQEELVRLQNHPKAIYFVKSGQLNERYFCQRCGKRVNYSDPISIHTCTPPADTQADWSAA